MIPFINICIRAYLRPFAHIRVPSFSTRMTANDREFPQIEFFEYRIKGPFCEVLLP